MLGPGGRVQAEPLPALGKVSIKKPLITASVPRKQSFTLISSAPLLLDGEPIGVVFLYDDAATKRAVDYLEIYNTAGDLVAVQWFDRFGIERTAIDRGILLEEGSLAGTLVLVLDGDFI